MLISFVKNGTIAFCLSCVEMKGKLYIFFLMSFCIKEKHLLFGNWKCGVLSFKMLLDSVNGSKNIWSSPCFLESIFSYIKFI